LADRQSLTRSDGLRDFPELPTPARTHLRAVHGAVREAARARSSLIVPAIPMAAFFVWMALAFPTRWRMFQLDYDFAYFTQAAHLIGHWRTTWVTFGGLPLLGDHAELTFFPIAILGRPFPATFWLPFVQIAALGTSAIPLSWIARREGLSPKWAAFALLVVMLHPALHGLALADYHPESIVVPLYLFAIWAALEERWIPFAICIAIALVTKEDQAAVVVMVALWLAIFRRRPVQGLITAIAAIAWGALAVKVLVPHFSPTGHFTRQGIFGSYGPTLPEALKQMVAHPSRVAHDLFQQKSKDLVVGLFAPFAFLPLAAPEILLPAAPILVGNMLAISPVPRMLESQYQSAVMPFLAAGLVLGMARLIGAMRPRAGSRRLLALPLLGAVTIGWLQLSPITLSAVWASTSPLAAAQERAVERVGPNDGVVATHDLAAHLGQREVIYPFPAPFHTSDGVVTARRGDLDRIDWMLLGNDPWVTLTEQVALTQQIVQRCGFVLESSEQGVLVYRRASHPPTCQPM
jgi:uncharacterized membrane protein